MRIEVLKLRRQWYFRIKARNGRIMCHSENYSSKAKALKSAMSLRGRLMYGRTGLPIRIIT